MYMMGFCLILAKLVKISAALSFKVDIRAPGNYFLPNVMGEYECYQRKCFVLRGVCIQFLRMFD